MGIRVKAFPVDQGSVLSEKPQEMNAQVWENIVSAVHLYVLRIFPLHESVGIIPERPVDNDALEILLFPFHKVEELFHPFCEVLPLQGEELPDKDVAEGKSGQKEGNEGHHAHNGDNSVP